MCVYHHPMKQQYNIGRPLMQTDDAGCTTFWVFSYPFCATTLYGTVELVVDAIIFPIFKLLLLKKKCFIVWPL